MTGPSGARGGPGPSLAHAIAAVLRRDADGEQAREIAPDVHGGRNNPVQLGTISMTAGRLPQAAAERVFRNQDATDGDYYGDRPLRAAAGTARRVLTGEDGQDWQERPVDRANIESIDGFARYLSLPQPGRSLETSPHRPSRGDGRGTFVRVPRMWDLMLQAERLPLSQTPGETTENVIRPRPSITDPRRRAVRMMLDATDAGPARVFGDRLGTDENNSGALLGNFTLDRGKDENGHYISIYDRYDLDRVPLADKAVGTPFEIYDRMYYDSATYEPRPSLARRLHSASTARP